MGTRCRNEAVVQRVELEGVCSEVKVAAAVVHRDGAMAPQGQEREEVMSLIGLIVVLAVVGVLLWLVNTQIPMPQWMRTLINVLAIIIVCLWLLNIFGILGDINTIRIGPVR